MQNVEEAVRQGLVSGRRDQSFIDKLTAREEVDHIRKLVKKEVLTREDLLEIMYMLTGVESKLVNFASWDRYVLLKYFVWVREFVKLTEILYDYEEKLKKNNIKINNNTKQTFENNKMLMQHNVKFLIDLYLNIMRTSLSVGATGFLEILKQKFEMIYGGEGLSVPQEQKRSWFNIGGRK